MHSKHLSHVMTCTSRKRLYCYQLKLLFIVFLAVVPPEWSPWSPWSDCTPAAPCTIGTVQRARECLLGDSCYGDAIETKACENPCHTSLFAFYLFLRNYKTAK